MSERKVGVLLSYVSEAVKILTSLIYTPIMLRLLGQSEYGLYQLVYSVVSYLSLLSLGFGSSYMRFYSRFKVKDDKDGVARLNGMFMLIFCMMSLICILCGGVMLCNIEEIFGAGLTSVEQDKAKVLMTFMVLNLAITFPTSVFDCSVTAHEKFFFQKVIMVAQNVFNPFLTLPLLLMGYGSVGMVVVTTVLTVAKFLINVWYCYRKLHIRFIFRGFQFSLLKEMWIFTFFIFLNQIIDQVNWSVGKFLLGRYAGTAAVAVYGVGGQINSLYLQFSTSISNVFIPKVNKIVATSEDNEELTSLFTRIGRIQFIVMMLILSGFTFFGKPFIKYWAGEGYESAYYVTLLLIGPVTIPLIQNLGIEIQRAKNMHRTRSVVYFGIAILNVIISIPLTQRYDAVGAAIGTALALFIGNGLFMNWYYHSRIKLNMIFFWKNIMRIVPALVLPSVVGVIMVKTISFSNFIILGVGVIIYTMVYGVSMVLFGMNVEEKEMIMKPFNKIFRRCN